MHAYLSHFTLGDAMVARDYTLPSIHKCKQTNNPNVTHGLGQVQAQNFMPKILRHQFVDKANKGDLFPL